MLTRRDLGWAALGLSTAWGRASAAEPIAVPIRLTDQRVLLDVHLNGQGPYSFILDSGAEISCILGTKAKELSLKPTGSIKYSDTISYPTFVLKDLLIGDALRVSDVALMELDAPNLGGDGLLANGLLTAYDSELDFDQKQWRVHLDGGQRGQDFEPLPGHIKRRADGYSPIIYADTVLDGRPVPFLMDTGTPRPLVISYELGQQFGYLAEGVPYCPVTGGGGVYPQHYSARLVRSKTLQMGSIGMRGNFVLVRPKGSPGQPAVMGLPIMRTFNYWIEARAQKVWVRRSSLPLGGAFYSPSGLLLAREGDRVQVVDVGTGSPAAAAGVRPGDIIEGMDLATANARVNARAGTAVTLNARRGSQSAQVSFTNFAYL